MVRSALLSFCILGCKLLGCKLVKTKHLRHKSMVGHTGRIGDYEFQTDLSTLPN